MPVKIITHYQVTVSERRCMPRGLGKRDYADHRPRYEHKHAPCWLLPAGLPTLNTITQSIVWGICGRMADMPA